MRIVTLRGGHVAVEVTTEEAIDEIEKQMNSIGGKERSSVLVEDPTGTPAHHLDFPTEVGKLSENATVWVFPVIAGG